MTKTQFLIVKALMEKGVFEIVSHKQLSQAKRFIDGVRGTALYRHDANNSFHLYASSEDAIEGIKRSKAMDHTLTSYMEAVCFFNSLKARERYLSKKRKRLNYMKAKMGEE